MALSALACLAAWALAWGAAAGLPTPLGWVVVLGPLPWLAGLAARRPAWLATGFYLMTALAGLLAVRTSPALGLVAAGLVLWGWDVAWGEWAVPPRPGGGQRIRALPPGATVARATAATAAAVLLALAVGGLHLDAPLWLQGAVALATWAGVAWLARRASG